MSRWLFSLICLCSLFHGRQDQAVKSSQAIISQPSPLPRLQILQIFVFDCACANIRSLLHSHARACVCLCLCVSVSLCLCCCLSCVFTSFLEKKTDVCLCAPVYCCYKSYHLYSRGPNQLVCGLLPTANEPKQAHLYIKTVNRATGVSNQSRPMHNINNFSTLDQPHPSHEDHVAEKQSRCGAG